MDGAKTDNTIICPEYFAINSHNLDNLIIRYITYEKIPLNLYKTAYFSINTTKLRIITNDQF
jgi:hypothetical protein